MNETKTFPLIFTIPFHSEVKVAAEKQHISMIKFIMLAIVEKIAKEG